MRTQAAFPRWRDEQRSEAATERSRITIHRPSCQRTPAIAAVRYIWTAGWLPVGASYDAIADQRPLVTRRDAATLAAAKL
jgi:hypothetical protein